MDNLRVSTRLLILIGLLSSLLVAVGSLGLFGIGKSNDALRTVYEDNAVPLVNLGEIRSLMAENRAQLLLGLQHDQVSSFAKLHDHSIDRHLDAVEASVQRITTLWLTYAATPMNDEERGLVNDFAAKRTAYVKEGIVPVIAALRAERFHEANVRLLTHLNPLSTAAFAASDKLAQLQLAEAKKAYAEAAARYTTIRTLSLAAIGGGLLLAGLFGYILVRSISRQLGAEPGEAAAVARRVAAGDLSVRIALKAGDHSSLMSCLHKMQQSLAKVVTGVRQNAESVATASAQIAQGNEDLSQRTEQQASALQQTAATMEELGSTVSRNADNAQQANQLAQAASGVAVRGGEEVSRVVETMKGISDSSRRIADIIGTIDGIAFQTNILALNAAVEAARAGEQGRGFAVVASEVRTLAQRSAEAAKQIKNLISASAERVEQGTTLVDQAGQTMGEVVASVRRVSQMVGEISAASVEQSTGVGQVGEAVSQMDQVTQQNAALVEEGAAAAESLREQAQQLVAAVAVFKLGGGDHHPTSSIGEPACGSVARGPRIEASPTQLTSRAFAR